MLKLQRQESKFLKLFLKKFFVCNKCISSSVMYLKGVCTFFSQGPKMIQIVKRL